MSVKEKKSLLIEISGTPNAGKTSLIKSMNVIFRGKNIKYIVLHEAATFCKIKNKLSPEFNIWTFNYNLNLFLEAVNQNYDIVFWERGILDFLSWIQLYKNLKLISDVDYQDLNRYANINIWSSCLYKAYILKCDTEEAIIRDYIDGVSSINTEGTIVNREVLKIYNQSLNQVIENYKSAKCISIIDTTDLKQSDLNKIVFNDIISLAFTM